MKRYLFILLPVLLAACGGSEEAAPTDATGVRQLITEKRKELRELTTEIESLEDQLIALDPSEAPQQTSVAYRPLTTASFNDYATVQATVRATESAVASPEIPGRILRMSLDEGDPVRRGQLVAVLDVEGTETQRAELETAAELAKTVYERQQRLWEQNIGSELQYLQAKNNYDRIQKQLAAIDVQANKRNVYAPISGTVDQVFMRQGEAGMPGAPIVSILGTNDLSIVADAPENLLSKVRRGQRLKVKVPALDLEFEAPITRIGRTVDPANRTFEVEMDVPGRLNRELKANLLAEVEVLDFTGSDLLVLSQDLIQQEVSGERYVFVADEDEEGNTIARRVFIETGATYDNQTIIESGLSAGDRIITEGARGLSDGERISLTQDPLSPATNG